MMVDLPVHFEARVHDDTERICWGCGLRLVLPSCTPVFKCGWCGAITNQNMRNYKDKYFRWRRVRDRSFVCIVSLFMLFVICGGVWAVYPVIFSISFLCGISHSFITCILAVSTITSFSLSAFRSAGPPPILLWGSYPVVGKGDLEDYTFCDACSKPKSPQTHHCRSCGMCVLDMDHHCPFIGNCVGAGNHRHFIGFLISTIVSTTYVAMICTYCVSQEWPDNMQVRSIGLYASSSNSRQVVTKIIKELALGVMSCLVGLSTRGIILVYLIVISISVQIGLWMLLWQQLCYIYQGQTYLSHLSAQTNNSSNRVGRKDCQNLVRFFGFPNSVPRYLSLICWRSRKRHWK